MSKFNKDPSLGKNSHNNKESREGKILRYVREARKLSLKEVAAKMSLKALDIDHFENGRKFYTDEDINMFLKNYGFSKDDFTSIMNFKILSKQVVNHFILQIQNQSPKD
jgi:transcriptional regulator with XRE-family HTH domain